MVDVPTAQHHGVCPTCEGYGGRTEDGYGADCPNETCIGSCSWCWCPGCHDGWNGPDPVTLESGEACGSWEAYELVSAQATAERSLPEKPSSFRAGGVTGRKEEGQKREPSAVADGRSAGDSNGG